jgi:hypothetical protein
MPRSILRVSSSRKNSTSRANREKIQRVPSSARGLWGSECIHKEPRRCYPRRASAQGRISRIIPPSSRRVAHQPGRRVASHCMEAPNRENRTGLSVRCASILMFTNTADWRSRDLLIREEWQTYHDGVNASFLFHKCMPVDGRKNDERRSLTLLVSDC